MLEKASRSRPSAEERPVGEPVAPPPGRVPDHRLLYGGSVTLEPLDVGAHAFDLWESFHNADPTDSIWTYLGCGPFAGYEAFRDHIARQTGSKDPFFYAVVPRGTGKAAGVASFLRITPEQGVIEVGHIWFSPALQKTREATESLYLLFRNALDEMGYRRLEWKCDALNAPSRRAAERYGFTFEGIFRQHMIVKGRNRDTAWYAILDREWPPLRDAYKAWLRDENFDKSGRQKKPLSALMPKQ
ncbi:MAG: GNAT family N-acetyltransferase [Parvibaculaceae bacterium]